MAKNGFVAEVTFKVKHVKDKRDKYYYAMKSFYGFLYLVKPKTSQKIVFYHYSSEGHHDLMNKIGNSLLHDHYANTIVNT